MKRRGKKSLEIYSVFKCPLTCDCDTKQWPRLALASCGSSGTSAPGIQSGVCCREGGRKPSGHKPLPLKSCLAWGDGHAHATNIRGISPLTHKSYSSKEE